MKLRVRNEEVGSLDCVAGRSSLVCFTHPPCFFLEALRQTVIESWTTRRPAIIPVLKVRNV